MKNFLIVVLFVVLFCHHDILLAGPFGLEKGMSLEKIGGNPEKISNGLYMIESVPRPHPSFVLYGIRVAPKTGLYMIKASSEPIPTNSFGIQLKTAFNEIMDKLQATYGNHKKIDELMIGSIWDNANDWMTALSKKERTLAAIFSIENGSTLPDDIKMISLYTDVVNGNRSNGIILIEYYFKNYDEGKAEIAASEDKVL